jgi:hypothetical protein
MSATRRLDLHQIHARNAASICGVERMAECVAELARTGLCVRSMQYDAALGGDPLISLEYPPPDRAILRGENIGLRHADGNTYKRYVARFKTCVVMWEVPL